MTDITLLVRNAGERLNFDDAGLHSDSRGFWAFGVGSAWIVKISLPLCKFALEVLATGISFNAQQFRSKIVGIVQMSTSPDASMVLVAQLHTAYTPFFHLS